MSVLHIRDTSTNKFIPITSINGLTPHIGENGNWWVGNVDTGTSASGAGGGVADSVAWGNVTGKPDTYPPAAHTHSEYLGKTETAANANQLNGKSADQYALKTDIPEDTGGDADTLGGKEPKYYIQPRNMLDNSDFTNPVNQRGRTGYIGNGYTIDRWVLWGDLNTGSLAIENGYIALNPETGSIVTLAQRFAKGYLDENKTYTLAYVDTRGNIHTSNNAVKYLDEFDYAEIVSNKWIGILWVALYEGEYTADNLPPYIPKGYAVELAECQRYYYRMSVSGNSGETNNIIGSGYWSSATDLRVQFTLPQVMRMYTPTVSTIGDGLASGVSGSIAPTPITALSRLWNCVGNNITLLATSTGGAAGAFGYLRLSVNGGIEVSADL